MVIWMVLCRSVYWMSLSVAPHNATFDAAVCSGKQEQFG